MRKVAILFVAFAGLAFATGCKHKTGTGGGGGGGWFVGTENTMRNVDDSGQPGAGYDIGSSGTLNGIACRYLNEAWVVGDAGTLLYTNDAGKSWSVQELGTAANLRSLATQDAGHVFVVGDGVFFTAVPDYQTGAAQWQQLGDGATTFVSVAAAQQSSTVLAISDSGGVWSYANGALAQRTTLAGARAVAISPDGETVIVAGAGLYRSLDGGATFQKLNVNASLVFNDVRIGDDGDAVAVGNAGVVARITSEGQVLVQHNGIADLRTIHIADGDSYDTVGYAAGVGGQVWITHDGGWTWSAGPNLGHTILGVDMIGDGHR
jgi:photosystem II stability/assembly factor-like uncharacterized protein